MASFIVISTNDRLHYLVDSIKECCPPNPEVRTNISTGKILKTGEGFVYEYTILGEESKSDQSQVLSYWLTNQIAQFRLVNSIPNDNLINIFLLENPITDEDFCEAKMWISAFDDVYKKGHDKSFCVYRMLFTYDLSNPSDVKKQVPSFVLSEILNSHKQCVENNRNLFGRYIFYIDNQKSDSAAFCIDKKEHDLKLPRLLTDFMMLSTNFVDTYGIRAAIFPPDINTKCFSIGFGESMYYYPDVERYYLHGDTRDIYDFILNTEDETFQDLSVKIMDIDKYPFGLKKREKRLSEIYEDVPYSEDIEKYPISADFAICKALSFLEDLLKEERDREFEQFFNSPTYLKQKQVVNSIQEKLNNSGVEDLSTEEDIDVQRVELSKQFEEEKGKLNKMVTEFKPVCPLFIDRSMIYDSISLVDDEEKENIEQSQCALYKDLLNFVISKQFKEFVKTKEDREDKVPVPELKKDSEDALSSRSGCLLSSLLFWKHNKQHSNDESQEKVAQEEKAESLIRYIDTIKTNLKSKSEFNIFKERKLIIESELKNEKNVCNTYKLTDHLNHFYHLINLDKLKEIQKESFGERRLKIVEKWNDDNSRTLNSLIDITKEYARQHTQKNYSYINWESPFPFVSDISKESTLPFICNQLQRRSAPLVNYNLNLEKYENRIIRIVFSDIPSFEEEVQEIKNRLDNGNEITAHFSSHIASKICMMQFLPMDESILSNLVDLQDEDATYNK